MSFTIHARSIEGTRRWDEGSHAWRRRLVLERQHCSVHPFFHPTRPLQALIRARGACFLHASVKQLREDGSKSAEGPALDVRLERP